MYNKTIIIIEIIFYFVTKKNTYIKQRQKSVNTHKTGKTTVSLKVQTNVDIFCCRTPISFKGEVITSRGKEGPLSNFDFLIRISPQNTY